MAHALCLNGHNMWNGDGSVCISAYRAGYVNEFSREYPDKVIDFDAEGDKEFAVWDIYDQGNPKEEYDIWRCTECKALSIWDNSNDYRGGYKVTKLSQNDKKDYENWEKYYVFNNETEDDFLDRIDNRNLTIKEAMEVFEKETDKMMYAYISGDYKKIVVTNNKGGIIREYLQHKA